MAVKTSLKSCHPASNKKKKTIENALYPLTHSERNEGYASCKPMRNLVVRYNLENNDEIIVPKFRLRDEKADRKTIRKYEIGRAHV